MRKASAVPVAVLVLFALASFVAPVLAANYTLTVGTGQSSYSGSQSVTINGTVSPPPGPNTAVIVTVENPNNATVDIQDDAVNASTGAYSQVTVAGGGLSCAGIPCWIAGTYLVNATWGGLGATAVQTTTFVYSPSSTSSTSTNSSSTSSTSSSTSSSSSSTTSSSSSTTTTTSSTSQSTVTSTQLSSSSTTTSTSSSSSSGGSSAFIYVILAAVAVIVIIIGLVLWRRKVTDDYSRQSTTTPK